MSYDLLLTRDKNNILIGGGYTLNSSFLNSNIPAFMHVKGGGGSESDMNDKPIPAKVSDIFERANGKNALVIPAGIFMIHSNVSSADGAPVSMKTKLKELLYYNNDSSDNSDNSDNSDADESKNDNHVVPDDLYEKLLGLVSPSQVNRYWDPKSTTRKRRNNKLTTKSKTRNLRHK